MKTNIKKIFIVDDDIFYLEITKQILCEDFIDDIYSFESGIDCLNDIHQNPDVVFLDYQMDEYSGFETLQKIKRYNSNIFVVMVSAQEEIQNAVETLKHGAFDYIRKDEHLEKNIKGVLIKIIEVKELLKSRKPSFLKSIFKYF
jgi:DNA-binding NtrC family response regulator